MFLIVFDLLFQMQEKSGRSISKKGRNALIDLIFCLSIDEMFLASERARQILSETLVPRF